MNLRDTDQIETKEELREIRRSRRKLQNWRSIAVAASAAFAAGIGGGDLVSYVDNTGVEDELTLESAREMHHKIEDRFNAKIAENATFTAAFNTARWEEIAGHLETQRAIVDALRSSVEGLVTRCAQSAARDESMQHQLEDLREWIRDDRRIIYQHIGLSGMHEQEK